MQRIPHGDASSICFGSRFCSYVPVDLIATSTPCIYTPLLSRVQINLHDTMQSQGLMLLLEDPPVYEIDDDQRARHIIAVREDR